MASSEDIEARLCAYIEGDLDPIQQAEIERHLAAHPQHRMMIEELIRTRALLGGLPRALAPSELGEGLQGQLERSMLLGDSQSGSIIHDPWQQHIRRVPHMVVVAAVLFLTVGLGSVVYYLLHTAAKPAGVYGPIAMVPATQPEESPVPAEAVSAQQPTITTQPSLVVVTPIAPTTMPVDDNQAIQASMLGAPSISTTSISTTQPVVALPDTQPSESIASTDLNIPTSQPVDSTAQPATQPITGPIDDALSLPNLDHLTDPTTQRAIQALAIPDSPQPAIQQPSTQPVAAGVDGK